MRRSTHTSCVLYVAALPALPVSHAADVPLIRRCSSRRRWPASNGAWAIVRAHPFLTATNVQALGLIAALSHRPALNAASMMGPLVSAAQLVKSVEIVEHSTEIDGLTLLCGGARMAGASPLDGFDLSAGYFFPPTILGGPGVLKSRVWREEVFGPVICVASFAVRRPPAACSAFNAWLNLSFATQDEAEAIRLANDCDFGLGGASP
jgi:hypothetical protein